MNKSSNRLLLFSCKPLLSNVDVTCYSKREKGFTLLEIMVALAVLALSGIALLGNVNQATNQMARLDEKLVALNVAEYALNAVLVEEKMPELGSEEEIAKLAERDWRVEITVSETENEDVRRVDVLVRPYDIQGQKEQAATVLLSGFQTDFFSP